MHGNLMVAYRVFLSIFIPLFAVSLLELNLCTIILILLVDVTLYMLNLLPTYYVCQCTLKLLLNEATDFSEVPQNHYIACTFF